MSGVQLFTILALAASLAAAANASSPEFEFQLTGVSRRANTGALGVHHDLTYQIGRRGEFWDVNSLELIRDSGATLIRGPDGTPANFYQWRQGTVINSRDPDYYRYFGKARYPGVEDTIPKKGFPLLTLTEASAGAAKLGLPMAFCLNVTTQTPAEVAEEVRALLPLLPRLPFLELGNEVYDSYGESAFPDPSSYIRRALQVSAAIHAIDPKLRTGIVAEPTVLEDAVFGGKARFPANTRLQQWNAAIARNRDAADAVVVHQYAEIKSIDPSATNLMRMLFAANLSLANSLAPQRSTFGDRPIWVTEWGILPLPLLRDGAGRDKLQFMKTPGIAVVLADRLLRLVAEPAVEIAAIHDLIDAQGFGLAQRHGERLVRLPAFYAFQAVSQLVRDHPYFHEVSWIGRTQRVKFEHDDVDLPDVSAWVFGHSAKPTRVALINHSSSPVRVRLAHLKLRRIWAYGGADPLPDYLEYPRKWLDPPPQIPAPDTTDGATEEAATIQPFQFVIAAIVH